nr:hypothetical protein CFP56_13906 [Quercus suber]
MTEEVGKDIGGTIGKFLGVDKRSWQSNQAKYMRIKVDVQLEKPLRRGGFVSSPESGKHWVYFKYVRIPTLWFRCGRIGHDVKHCSNAAIGHETETQYGDWMRVGWDLKGGSSKSRTTGSEGRATTEEGTGAVGNHALANTSGLPESDSLEETIGSDANPTLGTAQRVTSAKNLTTLLLQTAKIQDGWDKVENLKRIEKAKGISHDKGERVIFRCT